MNTKLTFYQARNNLGLSIKQVAEDTDISISTIKRAEQNNENMNLFYFHRLCKYYGINPSHIYVGETKNGKIPNLLVRDENKYSREAISLALQSEHAERLEDIEAISSIMRLELTGDNLQKQGARQAADKLYILMKLEAERDSILKPFQEQVEQQKKVVDLEKFIEEFGIGDLDELVAIINTVKNEKSDIHCPGKSSMNTA